MGEPAHLGVICVDVNDLLNSKSRIKVQRHDNMILHNGSYLISDHVPSLSSRGSVTRRGSSVTSLARECSLKKTFIASGKSSSYRRRTGSKKVSGRKSVNTRNGGDSKSLGRSPTLPYQHVWRKNSPFSGRKDSGRLVSTNSLAGDGGGGDGPLPALAVPRAPCSLNATFSRWSSCGRSLLASLYDVDGTDLRVSSSGLPPATDCDVWPAAGRQTDKGEEGQNQVLGHSQLEVREPQLCDVSDGMSDCAKRAIGCMMKSLENRVWNEFRKLEDELPTVMGENEQTGECTKGNFGGTVGSVFVTPVGALDLGKPLPAHDAWGAPPPQPAKPAPRSKKIAPSPLNNLCRLQDSRGVERVVILGVVPKVPRPVVSRQPRHLRLGADASAHLPPPFRRTARTVFESANSRRPKRF